jgi:hypothetical protein
VRDRSRLGGVSPHAAHPRAGEGHDQLRAGVGGDLHALRRLEQPHAGTHGRLQLGVRHEPLERFRVLVGDHQHARAAFEDGLEFRRVQQAFHRAVGDEATAGQGGDRRAERLQRVRRAGGADGNRHRLDRGNHLHMERPRPQPQQRQLRQVHVDAARLGFGEDGADFSGRHLAQLEDPDEG